jgi:hypothetical protein
MSDIYLRIANNAPTKHKLTSGTGGPVRDALRQRLVYNFDLTSLNLHSEDKDYAYSD